MESVVGRDTLIANGFADQSKGTNRSGSGWDGIRDTISPLASRKRQVLVRRQGPRHTPTSTLGTCLVVDDVFVATALRLSGDMATFQQLPNDMGTRLHFLPVTISLGVRGWLRELMLSFMIAAIALCRSRVSLFGIS